MYSEERRKKQRKNADKNNSHTHTQKKNKIWTILKWNEKWYFFMSLFLTIRYDGHFLSEIRFKNKKKQKKICSCTGNGHSCQIQ